MDGDTSSRGEAPQARSLLVTGSGGRARPGKLYLRLRSRVPGVLSQRMTAANGTPYRGVQFLDGRRRNRSRSRRSTGWRAPSPSLGRCCSSVPVEIKRSDAIFAAVARPHLRKAPIGTAIAHPWLFPLEKRFYDIPLRAVRGAVPRQGGLRAVQHLPAQGSDLYWIDDFGDTVSFSYQTSRGRFDYLRSPQDGGRSSDAAPDVHLEPAREARALLQQPGHRRHGAVAQAGRG